MGTQTPYDSVEALEVLWYADEGVCQFIHGVQNSEGDVDVQIHVRDLIVPHSTAVPNPFWPQPAKHIVDGDDDELHDVSPPWFDLVIVVVVGGLGILRRLGGGESGSSEHIPLTLR